jgi:hypothetical protein
MNVNRVKRGSVFIPNLSVCLLGGIQPDVIRRLAADGLDDGLLLVDDDRVKFCALDVILRRVGRVVCRPNFFQLRQSISS